MAGVIGVLIVPVTATLGMVGRVVGAPPMKNEEGSASSIMGNKKVIQPVNTYQLCTNTQMRTT